MAKDWFEDEKNYRREKKELDKKREERRKKIFHDVSCDCYDCRLGISLKAKD